MNQEKIGKFIAEQRKDKSLTQEQLAEKIGVSKNAVSKWERGVNLPDVSLFFSLCGLFNISVNELLKGERLPNISEEDTHNIALYAKYLKSKEKKKRIYLTLISLIIIFILVILLILGFNKTFFRTMYNSNYYDNINIPIPKYSFYRSTSGIDEYNTKLKTLKQVDEVNIIIDSYLNKLEKIECNNKIYYYNKNKDFTVIQYRINNDGISFINTIYLTYINGNICKLNKDIE